MYLPEAKAMRPTRCSELVLSAAAQSCGTFLFFIPYNISEEGSGINIASYKITASLSAVPGPVQAILVLLESLIP